MVELMKKARVDFSKEYDREASKVAQDLQMEYFKVHQVEVLFPPRPSLLVFPPVFILSFFFFYNKTVFIRRC